MFLSAMRDFDEMQDSLWPHTDVVFFASREEMTIYSRNRSYQLFAHFCTKSVFDFVAENATLYS